jgi:hypothetical protein
MLGLIWPKAFPLLGLQPTAQGQSEDYAGRALAQLARPAPATLRSWARTWGVHYVRYIGRGAITSGGEGGSPGYCC